MSMLFKSVTAVSILSLCPLISISNGVLQVTTLFLIPSALKTSNILSTGSILIHSSLTSCLLIPVWVQPESTNACNCNSFPIFVLILVYIFSSLTLLFLQFGIMYQFWALLYTKVHHIMSALNLRQNPSSHLLHLIRLFFLSSSGLSSSAWTCSLLLDVPLCHICSTFLFPYFSLASCILLPYACICYS